MEEAKDELAPLFTDPAKQSGKEESRTVELKAAVTAVFNTDHMSQKGVINSLQMLQLARARVYSKRFGSTIMDSLVDYLLEFSVSNKGRGRGDLRTLLQAIMHKEESEEDTIRKKLLGA